VALGKGNYRHFGNRELKHHIPKNFVKIPEKLGDCSSLNGGASPWNRLVTGEVNRNHRVCSPISKSDEGNIQRVSVTQSQHICAF
jgi:hypothetical protein